MGAYSKGKGAGFERLVCKRLSLWISGGKKPDVFWRSAMSGGRATVMAKKGTLAKASAGDITATGPEGHQLTDAFFLECKSYRNLALQPFLLGLGKGTLAKFWSIAEEEARKYDKMPLLIAKQNNLPPFVLMSLYGAETSINGAQLGRRTPVLRMAGDVLLYWFDDLFPLPRARIKK